MTHKPYILLFTLALSGCETIQPDAREGSTVHMLYDCGSRGWRTYGVANGTIDSRPMTEREYMGKVTLIIHTTKE